MKLSDNLIIPINIDIKIANIPACNVIITESLAPFIKAGKIKKIKSIKKLFSFYRFYNSIYPAQISCIDGSPGAGLSA